MYDLDCVDEYHFHGRSIGKYLMVNRVKNCKEKDLFFKAFALNLSSPTSIGLLIFSIVNKQAQASLGKQVK